MEELNNLFDDHLFDLDKVKEKTIKLKDGERRMVSVLFADVKGFTALSENLDHEDVQALMDHIMKIFSNSVEVYGGYVDKYTGDQIMALFGAKVASEVDTQRAISCGLDLIDKLKKFNTIATNSKRFKNTRINLSIRVGINTGMVTTGKIGKEREGDFTVYGDAVNLAARMESNAPTDAVMIPEESMHLVEENFNFTDNGEIKVKGKEKPISVFLVDSKKDFEVRHASPFIGRDNELSALKKIYNKCVEYLENDTISKISFVGIHADAGVGKSRLVYEFIENVDCEHSTGSCTNISSHPYHIFSTLIKDAFTISIIDNSETIKSKFNKGFLNLVNSNPLRKDDLNNSKPFLGMIMGIKYEDERLNNKSEFINHMHNALRTFLECLCTYANKSQLPYIIILEDIHWIDKMSYNALLYILDTFNLKTKRGEDNLSLPIILSSFRNEYLPEDQLKNITLFTNLELNTLTKEASIELIDVLSSKTSLSLKKKKELYVKSEGNPFFIEEWINLLNTDSNIQDIPDSLNSLILSRIDSLNKDVKSLLQKATVIGEDFFIKMLSLLQDKLGLSNSIDENINFLEHENFIQEFLKEPTHYRFKHILTRDVSYNTILKSNKKILHNSVAEIIEEHFSDSIDSFLYDLSVHYDMSENYNKAITYLHRAGKRFYELSDKTKALKCYNRIVYLVNNHQNEITLENIDEIYHTVYLDSILINLDFGNSDQALEKLNNYNPLNDLKTAMKEIILGSINYTKKNIPTALEHYNFALDIYKKKKMHDDYHSVNRNIAISFIHTGKHDESIEILNKAYDHFKTNNNVSKLTVILGNIGSVYLSQGEFKKSYDFFKKQYDLSSENNAKASIQSSLGNMANITNFSGDHKGALTIFQQLISICEDLNDKDGLSKTYNNIGLCNKLLRDYDNAMKNYKKSISISEQLGDKGEIAFGYMNMGLVYHKLSDYEKSLKNYKKSSKIAKEANDIRVLSFLHGNFGILYTDMGDLEHALEEYNSAQKIFEQINEVRGKALTNYEISKVLFFKDNYIKALPLLSNATETLKKLGDLPYFTKSMLSLAMLYRLEESYEESSNSIDSLEKNIENMTKASKERIYIEKYTNILAQNINDININKLIEMAEKTPYDTNKGYIYYNLWFYSKNEDYRKISISVFKELFKIKPKHRFKYFINKLS